MLLDTTQCISSEPVITSHRIMTYENPTLYFKCLFCTYYLYSKVKKHRYKRRNKLVCRPAVPCCTASIYIYTTGPAVPAPLAPLVSPLRAQCMMVCVAWLVTTGCALLFMMHCGKQ